MNGRHGHDLTELYAAIADLANELRECAGASAPAKAARMRTLAMTLGGYGKALGSADSSGNLVVALLRVDDVCHAVTGLELHDNSMWRLMGEEKVQRIFDLTVPLRRRLANAGSLA